MEWGWPLEDKKASIQPLSPGLPQGTSSAALLT